MSILMCCCMVYFKQTVGNYSKKYTHKKTCHVQTTPTNLRTLIFLWSMRVQNQHGWTLIYLSTGFINHLYEVWVSKHLIKKMYLYTGTRSSLSGRILTKSFAYFGQRSKSPTRHRTLFRRWANPNHFFATQRNRFDSANWSKWDQIN